MTKYRYDYDHKAKKSRCPACGQMRLRTYIDVETRQPCDPKYGVCDRIQSCGYHHYPENPEPYTPKHVEQPIKRTDWRCPPNIVAATQHSAGNSFATWLVSILGDPARQALRSYRVGTYPASQRFPGFAGAMVYWQISHDNLHRTGKVIPYHPNGKRVKELGSKWIHHMLFSKSMDELGIGQCLFGEHLLFARHTDEVCVVESEKSAIICSIFYPDKVWVATGGSENFSVEKCIALQGRKVWVFPDVGMYAKWSEKAIDIEVMCESLHVSDVLEAMGVEQGSDLADLLMWEQDGSYYNAIAARGVELFPCATHVAMQVAVEAAVQAVDPQRQRIDAWNAAVAAPVSPAQELFKQPVVKLLVDTIALDTENYKVLPHEDLDRQ